MVTFRIIAIVIGELMKWSSQLVVLITARTQKPHGRTRTG